MEFSNLLIHHLRKICIYYNVRFCWKLNHLWLHTKILHIPSIWDQKRNGC